MELAEIAISTSPEALRELSDPDCNIAIWQRKITPSFENLLKGARNDVRFRASLTELAEHLQEQLKCAGYPESAERDELIADIRALADHFCSAMNSDSVEIRLEVVSTNSCRKWHADYVTSRLITTYVGQGTQWLTSADADRVKAGSQPRRINTLNPGDVGLFKGKLATDKPAIHRSPPIEGTGERRLLLVLNPSENI